MLLARHVQVQNKNLVLSLHDKRTVKIPLQTFPGIRLAPAAAQRNVRVVNGGTGIYWPILGHEFGVGGLVRACKKQKGCWISSE
jgi:hypothetical protein